MLASANGAALAGPPGLRHARALGDLSDWDAVRDLFALSPDRVHMSAMLIASHPAPVREAIERHRDGLDADLVGYLETNGDRLTEASREAAAVVGQFKIREGEASREAGFAQTSPPHHVKLMQTFMAHTERANMKAEGGKDALRWIVLANDIGHLASLLPGAGFGIVDQGEQLDQRAKAAVPALASQYLGSILG